MLVLSKYACSLTVSIMSNIIMYACAFAASVTLKLIIYARSFDVSAATMLTCTSIWYQQAFVSSIPNIMYVYSSCMSATCKAVIQPMCPLVWNECRRQFSYAATANLFSQCRQLTRLQFVARQACFMYNYVLLHSHLRIIYHFGFNLHTNGLSRSAHERERIASCRALMSRRAFRRWEALTERNGYRTMWSWPSRPPGGVTRILVTCNNA
jgi:hypothetical protein